MKKSRKVALPVGLALLLLALAASRIFLPAEPKRGRDRSPEPDLRPGERREVQVDHVYDGDTVRLHTGGDVRLIGVDTPEMNWRRGRPEAGAREALDFLENEIVGKRAVLIGGPEATDRYGRHLAYLYTLEGTHLNAELIRRGFGRAMRRFPHPKMEQFIQIEQEAESR